MNRHFITTPIVLVLFSLLAVSVATATRGIKTVPIKDKQGNQVGLYKESHALVIGVSDYTAGWPDLPGVLKDVRLVKEALEANGFNVVVKQDLNHDQFESTFKEFINQYGHTPDARLLFYFAGHGHTLRLAYGGDMGYIIPTDAPNPNRDKNGFLAKAMSMEQIEVYAKNIQAKHAMFLFDSCFSGSIFALSRAVPRNISYKTSEPVRQFITAGSANETVPDESIFRDQFVRALQGEGDSDADGYLTGVELGEFLQKKVVNYSNESQHPQYGKIRNPFLDKGDFVFPLQLAGLPPVAIEPATPEITQPPPARETALERILREAEEKKQKAASIKQEKEKRLKKIENLFAKLEGVDKIEEAALAAESKMEVWREFINQYPEDNPKLEYAQKRLQHWQKMASLPVKERQKVSQCQDNMASIPAGEYMAGSEQGSSDEKPVHPVLVNTFCMDKYEVTQAEYEQVMGKNPSGFKGSNRPVENVTWFEAKEYCGKVGKRLPTEAEWEKAARGNGNPGDYWYSKNSGGETHPVGQKSANGYGQHDMLGNVWEWVEDWYDADYYRNAPRNNPKGPSSGNSKVLRGGSWDNTPNRLRTAYRAGYVAANRQPQPRVSVRVFLFFQALVPFSSL